MVLLIDHDPDRPLDQQRGPAARPVLPGPAPPAPWNQVALVQHLPVAPVQLVKPERHAILQTLAVADGLLAPAPARRRSPSWARR